MNDYKYQELREEIADYILTNIDDYEETEMEELHYNLFNTDYYIIGTHEATKWLEKYNTFHCIDYVQEWEDLQFGETTTNLADPEKIVNMLVYIIGYEILEEIYNETEDIKTLTKKDIKTIKKAIEDKIL